MAKQLSTDEESNLKRKARRRLIGAVALTTAVVVILPMVLDSEPAPSAQDIELRIPDKEQAGEFAAKVELPASSAVAPALPAAVQPQAASAVAVAPLRNSPAPAPAAQPKAEARPAAVVKPVSVPRSGFVVQVGAFTNTESARQLQAKLSGLGFHAYTEKAGNATRVRVGSYPTHDAADKAKRKLEAQGLHPNVVSLN